MSRYSIFFKYLTQLKFESYLFLDIHGCQFHFSKCLWKRIRSNKMKPFYSDVKNPEFSSFIKATLSLPFVPLERLDQALDILRSLQQKIKPKKAATFAKQFLKYIEKTWINSKRFPPKTWNFFMYDGVTTNNFAEGYNSRLSHKKKLGKHPNCYLFA